MRLPLLVAGACFTALSMAGCSSSSKVPRSAPTPQAVPAELRAACGHHGTIVTLKKTKLPITLARSDCNLAGVTIVWMDGQDTVPGGQPEDLNPGTRCDASSGLTCPSIVVDGKTGAVTIEPAAS